MKIHDVDENKGMMENGTEQISLPIYGGAKGAEEEENSDAKKSTSTEQSDLHKGEGLERQQPAWDPMQLIEVAQEKCIYFWHDNIALMRALLLLAGLALYHVFLVLALLYDFHRAHNLLAVTALCWLYIFHKRIAAPFLKRQKEFEKFKRRLSETFHELSANCIVRRTFYALAVGIPLFYVLWDTRKNHQRLSGLLGLFAMFVGMCLISHKPTKVNWRPIIWGFLLQFIFGLLVLKWEWGTQRFVDLSDVAITFLGFTKNGTDFTYGFLSTPPNICGMEPVLAFQVIQVIIYVGSIVSVLYFYGIVQAVLKRMAWLMQFTMGTTATESLNACACVLLGNAESPLLIRPYIEKMTASELHAIMTTGFACIAGAVFAAYISFGACPGYLLSAAVMSAPGSLACSKLLYPEIEKSHVKSVKDLELPPSKESNAMECVSNGSVVSVHLVTAVLANLVSFMALMALLNALVVYAGGLIGYEWNLELFFGYIFFPVAYLIGVTESLEQTQLVARLIGVKIVINDFVAYKRLGEMLKQDLLTPRSAMLSTYSLCSFSDFIAAGVQLAVLSEMAPSRKRIIAKLVLRALLAGLISCFMSAAIAGILIEEPIACKPHVSSSNCFDLNVHQKFMEDVLSANITGFRE